MGFKHTRTLLITRVVLYLCLVVIAGLPASVSSAEYYEGSVIEIPFAFAGRPTVYASFGDMTLPLLFDTGTKCSILLDSGKGSLPPGLVFSIDPYNAAKLDGKPRRQVRRGSLRYAAARSVMLGNTTFQKMQFRVYHSELSIDADFRGAVSPFQFGDTHVIEVRNSQAIIIMTPHTTWNPQPGGEKFPLVEVEQGIFIPLLINGKRWWFQLDTGFSGELAVTPESQLGAPDKGDAGNPTTEFKGWGGDYEFAGCAEISVGFGGINRLATECVLLPKRHFNDVAGLEVGGVAGAELLVDMDYAFDLVEGCFYITPHHP